MSRTIGQRDTARAADTHRRSQRGVVRHRTAADAQGTANNAVVGQCAVGNRGCANQVGTALNGHHAAGLIQIARSKRSIGGQRTAGHREGTGLNCAVIQREVTAVDGNGTKNLTTAASSIGIGDRCICTNRQAADCAVIDQRAGARNIHESGDIAGVVCTGNQDITKLRGTAGLCQVGNGAVTGNAKHTASHVGAACNHRAGINADRAAGSTVNRRPAADGGVGINHRTISQSGHQAANGCICQQGRTGVGRDIPAKMATFGENCGTTAKAIAINRRIAVNRTARVDKCNCKFQVSSGVEIHIQITTDRAVDIQCAAVNRSGTGHIAKQFRCGQTCI